MIFSDVVIPKPKLKPEIKAGSRRKRRVVERKNITHQASSLNELLNTLPDDYSDAINMAYLLGYEKGKSDIPKGKKADSLLFARIALGQLIRAVDRLVETPTFDVLSEIELELATAKSAFKDSN
jgi:hypothetical protein